MNRRAKTAGVTLAASTAVLGALLLSSCGTTTGSVASGGNQQSTTQPTTLIFQWWGNAQRAKLTTCAVDKFEAAYPNVHIQTEYADYTPYQEKLATETAGGHAPDIFQMDLPYMSTFGNRGALLDLNTLGQELKLDQFPSGELQTGEVGGKLYGLVNGINAPAMVVNASLLKKAGVAMPDDKTWTWDDLLRDAAAVSKAGAGKYFGLEEWGYDEDTLYYWERDHGSAVFDGSGQVTADPSSVQKFFQYVADLQAAGATGPASVVAEDYAANTDNNMMATNRVAFNFEYTNALSALRADSGSDMRLLHLPTSGASSAPEYYNASQFWSISARTKHPDQAGLFVNFLANNKSAADCLVADRGIPANTSIRSYLAPKLGPADRDQVSFLNGLKVSSAPAIPPAGATNIHATLQKYAESVMFKRMTPADAAQGFLNDLKSAVNNGS